MVLVWRSKEGRMAAMDKLVDVFLNEHKCVKWISGLNREEVVTPGCHIIAEYRKLLKRGELTAASNGVYPGKATSSNGNAVCGFRRKWRMRIGKPLERDVMQPQVLKENAI